MIYPELFFAYAVMLAGGLGCILFALPKGSVQAPELAGLSIIAGVGIVSLLLFTLGFILHDMALRWAVTLICAVMAFLGVRRAHDHITVVWPEFKGARSAAFFFILALQLLLVIWQTLNRPLVWDGLISWEFKARMAFLNGGSIPLAFFSDPSRPWSHPQYPLGLPLAEYWGYAWTGKCDHTVAKTLFPFFYVACICFLFTGIRKLGGGPWRGAGGILLLFFVPSFVVEPGGIASGWADAPLATIYLASVIYLHDCVVSGSLESRRLLAMCTGILPWIKAEGIILWACVYAIACLFVLRNQRYKSVLMAAIPGLLIFAIWKIFTIAVNASSPDFLPLSTATFFENLGRLFTVAEVLVIQIFKFKLWSLLWIATPLALVALARRGNSETLILLASSLFLPVVFYSGTYIFSNWQDVQLHMMTSLPRLLLHVCPVAVMTIALAVPSSCEGQTKPLFFEPRNIDAST